MSGPASRRMSLRLRLRLRLPGLLLSGLLLAGCEWSATSAPPRPALPSLPATAVAVPAAASSAGSADHGRAEPSAASAQARPGGEPHSAAPGAPVGLGRTCSCDRDCPGYLRCQQGSCAIPPAVRGDGPSIGPTVFFDLGQGKEVAFRVELARESFEQMRGLMFRPAMDPRWGMIFLYDQDEVHSFWMRNTLIPLDMVFLGADGKVTGVVEQAEPLTLEGRSCGRHSRHVLELVAGTVHRLGIRAGTPYRLVDFPADLPGTSSGGGTGMQGGG